MKGLLRCDWYQAVKYQKFFLLLLLVFTAVSFVQTDNLFFVFYPMVMTAMIPVSLIGFYDSSSFTTFADTTPLSRSAFVSAKYLNALVCELVILLVVGAGQLIQRGLSRDTLVLLCTLATLGLLAPSFTLPFLFRFGTQKGRIAYYLCIGVICAMAIFIPDLIQDGPTIHLSAWLLPVLSLGLFALSWGLSILFYKKREL